MLINTIFSFCYILNIPSCIIPKNVYGISYRKSLWYLCTIRITYNHFLVGIISDNSTFICFLFLYFFHKFCFEFLKEKPYYLNIVVVQIFSFIFSGIFITFKRKRKKNKWKFFLTSSHLNLKFLLETLHFVTNTANTASNFST